MAERVLVTPEEAWDYFADYGDDVMGEEIKMAENLDYGVEIYATGIWGADGQFMAEIDVNIDGNLEVQEWASDRETFISETGGIFDTYLGQELINHMVDWDVPEELSPEEEKMAIEDREDELDNAVIALLEEFAPELSDWDYIGGDSDGKSDIEEIIDSLKDLICEFLYKKFEVSVYRPMFVEDEDGKDVFLEYPYPEIE